MEETKWIDMYRKWVLSRSSEEYPITENEKGNLEIKSNEGIGVVNFYDENIVELRINTIPDDEVAFFLHFQLLEEDNYNHAQDLFYDMETAMRNLKKNRTYHILLSCTSALTTSYFAEVLNEAAEKTGMKYKFRAVSFDHKLYGEDRLARILAQAKDFAPMDICHIVEDDVAKFVDGAPQSDDITMLSFRVNYLSGTNSICVRPDENSIELVTEYVDEKLAKFNVSPSVRSKVQISVDEIFSNIVKYGSATKAEIRFGFEEEQLGITFTDNGTQFDPTIQEAPDVTLSAEERKIGGLGIFLVKKLSSSCTYEYKDGNNCLNVVFNLKGDSDKK